MVCRALCHGGIQTGAALFDGREVESGGVCNGLKEVGIAGVRVSPGNCRVPPFAQVWNGLREDKTGLQVGVVVANTVSRPPTGVHGELREVSQPQLPAGCTSRGTAWQGTKSLQTDGISSLRHEVRVQEVLVSKFVIRIVVNVLRHIGIQNR